MREKIDFPNIFQTTQQSESEEHIGSEEWEAINLKSRADCFDFYLFLRLNLLTSVCLALPCTFAFELKGI